MKNLFSILFLALATVFFISCSTGKTPCYSTKFVDVVFVTKSGVTYTLAVPYCDTVRLYTEKPPAAAKMEVKP